MAHLDPAAEEFYPATHPPPPLAVPPPPPQLYYPYSLPPPPLPPPQQHAQYVGAAGRVAGDGAATRAVVLSMVPPHAGEGAVREAMEAFGGVRAVEVEALHAEGVATVHFFDLRSAQAAVATVRDQHVRQQSRLSQQYALVAAGWPWPWPHEAEQDGGARGLVAGQAVWAQFGAKPLDARNQGSLLVLNSDGVSAADLANIFQAFGAVKEVREAPPRHRHKLVEFYDIRDAARAFTELNRQEVLGRRLVLEFARSSDGPPRSGGGGGGGYQKRSSSYEGFVVPPRLACGGRQPGRLREGPSQSSPRGETSLTLLKRSGVNEKSDSSSSSGGGGKYRSPQSSSQAPPAQQQQQRKGWRHHGKKSGETRFLFKEAAAAAAAETEESPPARSKDSRTTVMIKNIPNKYSRALLLNMLDNHCIHCNEKIGEGGDEPLSAYDFVYLPIDFNNKCNVGYGFVNLTSPEATWRLYRAFHMQPWEVFNSRKICQVTYARLQGLEALKEHFRNSKFACDNDEYMPVLFSPPRDGRQLTDPVAIGGRGPTLGNVARMRRVRGRAGVAEGPAPVVDGGAASSTTTSTHAPSDNADDGGEDDDDGDVGSGGGGGGEEGSSSGGLTEALIRLSYSRD